ERLSRPGTLEHAAATGPGVAQHRPEHPQALAGGENAGARQPSHARHVLAHVRLGEGRDRGGIEVAVRRVIQQVADRADPEPRERIGPLGTDALQVLHRRRELERHDASTRRRANRAALPDAASPPPGPSSSALRATGPPYGAARPYRRGPCRPPARAPPRSRRRRPPRDRPCP